MKNKARIATNERTLSFLIADTIQVQVSNYEKIIQLLSLGTHNPTNV